VDDVNRRYDTEQHVDHRVDSDRESVGDLSPTGRKSSLRSPVTALGLALRVHDYGMPIAAR
jgi:hypothetical protein